MRHPADHQNEHTGPPALSKPTGTRAGAWERALFESPFWVLAVIVLSITIAELLTFVALRFVTPFLPESLFALADPALLFIFLSPILYFFLAQLFRYHVKERRLTEEALQTARERKYQAFIDTTMDAFALVDTEGRILELNTGLTSLTGYSRDELLAMTIFEVMGKEYLQKMSGLFQQVLETGVGRFEFCFHAKHGAVVDIEVSVTFSRTDNHLYAFVRDITEAKNNERKLRKAREELEEKVNVRTLELKSANEQLALRSAEIERRNLEIGQIGKMGELLSMCATTGEAYPVISRTLSRLFPNDTGALFVLNSSRNLLEPESVWGDRSALHEEIDPQSCWALRRGRCYSADDLDSGLQCPHLLGFGEGHFCMPLMAHGETLGVLHLSQGPDAKEPDHRNGAQAVYSLFANVAEKIGIAIANLKLGEALRSLSVRDPLTGLFNRRFMEESLERECALASRKGLTVGIIMLDIDHFKHFNDTFGHEAGDALLRQLGALIRHHVRGSDIACRYGGEEFTIIMPDAAIETVQGRAEELRAETARMHVHYDCASLGSITLSLGIAVFPGHGSSAQAILRAADAALYKAKRNGRDKTCTYTEGSDIDGQLPKIA